MAEPFDPYHVWLGIPPRERPVNHYRLLAIELFESNPEVIENATDQRMLLLRTFQVGKYSDLSQKLLNEVATAKVCLLRPEKKAAYDEQLRNQLQAKSEESVSQRPEIDSQLAFVLEQEAQKGHGHSRQAPKPGLGLVFGAAGAVTILVVIVTVWAATRKAPPAVQPVAIALERDSRNAALAGGSDAPQPPPASEGSGATSGLPEPLGATGVPLPLKAGSPDSSAIGVPGGTRGAAKAPVPNSPHVPPPAVAPFDAERAKQHQEAWAEYLGVPVETKNSIGMSLTLIPPGEFDMGSTPKEVAWAIEQGKTDKAGKGYFERLPSESPRHRVQISKPFFLGTYAVTQSEYEKVMGVNPSAFTTKQMEVSAVSQTPLNRHRNEYAKRVIGKDTTRHPVETVSWEDAMDFCRRLSAVPAERTARRVYRLPMEAEWEYACRAGTTTQWVCGDDVAGLADVAWYNKDLGWLTHPVGQKRANGWGLYDMHGNVFQWCSDWFGSQYYKEAPSSDPTGPTSGIDHVMRGGSWFHTASDGRSAFRSRSRPDARLHDCGFRVLVDGNGAQLARSFAVGRPTGTRRAGETPVAPKPTETPAAGVAIARPARPGSSNPQSPIPNLSPLLPVPTDAAREAAAKLAQALYHSDYDSARSPIARQALARRILDDALKAHDNPTERYVLLCLARDVAVAGQDDKLAIEAIDELGRASDVDAWPMKVEAMDHLAKGSRPTAARWELAKRALALAEEAFKADKLPAAGDLAKLAMAEAGKAHDKELVGRCRATSKEIQEALKASLAAEEARAQLKANPGDTAAHLALGLGR
jgi:formylglycine-generating enzyme required for sulfatase activity